MIRVTLFTKEDCHLCHQVRLDLDALQDQIPHNVVEVDIEEDPALHDLYFEQIPVVQVGAYTLRAPISQIDLRVALLAAQESLGDHPDEPEVRERQVAIRMNRWLHFFSRHWLAFFNLFVFVYVGMPFAAPALMNAGYERPAKWIYTAYSPLCHQMAFRSWFLFGEQFAYPRASAGTDWVPYGQATGQSEDDTRAARNFLGDDRIGYKVALCERDIAIYVGILLAGLLFGLVRKRLKPLPLAAWFIFGIVPIALDGGTQLIGGFSFLSFLPPRESTPLLRTITGALFGVMNVWLAYPYVEESMNETRALVSAKLAGIETPSAAPRAD